MHFGLEFSEHEIFFFMVSYAFVVVFLFRVIALEFHDTPLGIHIDFLLPVVKMLEAIRNPDIRKHCTVGHKPVDSCCWLSADTNPIAESVFIKDNLTLAVVASGWSPHTELFDEPAFVVLSSALSNDKPVAGLSGAVVL